MCVECEDVFEVMYVEIFWLYVEGIIDGLWLDYIDGLIDFVVYCLCLCECL